MRLSRRRGERISPDCREAILDLWLACFECIAHIFRMALRLDVVVDGFHFAIATDDERAARDAHVRLAVHTLFGPDAMLLRSRRAFVREEEEGQGVVRLEGVQGRNWIGANADDMIAQTVEIGLQITEGYCFNRSAVCVRFGEIEKHHPPVIAHKIGHRVHRAIGAEQMEIGQRFTDDWQCVFRLRQ